MKSNYLQITCLSAMNMSECIHSAYLAGVFIWRPKLDILVPGGVLFEQGCASFIGDGGAAVSITVLKNAGDVWGTGIVTGDGDLSLVGAGACNASRT